MSGRIYIQDETKLSVRNVLYYIIVDNACRGREYGREAYMLKAFEKKEGWRQWLPPSLVYDYCNSRLVVPDTVYDCERGDLSKLMRDMCVVMLFSLNALIRFVAISLLRFHASPGDSAHAAIQQMTLSFSMRITQN